MTPTQASLKKNEGYVYKNLLDKRNKIKPKFQINNLVRTADLKKTFSKRDTTNWSYILYKITEIINDTIPCYKIDKLPERYNEALPKKVRINNERKQHCHEKIEFNLNQTFLDHPSLCLLICSLKLKRNHISQQE